MCFGVDVRHYLNLLRLLWDITLVDANGVNPIWKVDFVIFSDLQERAVQVLSDFERRLVTVDGSAVWRLPPDIRQSSVLRCRAMPFKGGSLESDSDVIISGAALDVNEPDLVSTELIVVEEDARVH
jgi:hypothetical protein